MKSSFEYLNSIRENTIYTNLIDNPSGRNQTNKTDYLYKAMSLSTDFGDWAEFGVQNGTTARLFLDKLPKHRNIYLFDWFQGLPEAWIIDNEEETGYFQLHSYSPKGSYKSDGIPQFKDDRAIIVNGLFEDTLLEWSNQYSGDQLALIHIDSDLYSSAKTIYNSVGYLLKPGTIICFDDYIRDHDQKAFFEWLSEVSYDFEYLLAVRGGFQVTVRLLEK
jgi:hypothetical protein